MGTVRDGGVTAAHYTAKPTLGGAIRDTAPATTWEWADLRGSATYPTSRGRVAPTLAGDVGRLGYDGGSH